MSLVEWSGSDHEAGRAKLSPDPRRSCTARRRATCRSSRSCTMQTVTDDLFAPACAPTSRPASARPRRGADRRAARRARRRRSPISQVELLALGGAISRVAGEATAFPYRNARWLDQHPRHLARPADDEREIGWARDTYAAISPTSPKAATSTSWTTTRRRRGRRLRPHHRAARRRSRRATTQTTSSASTRTSSRRCGHASARPPRSSAASGAPTPEAWADLAESHNQPCSSGPRRAASVPAALLDVGCGPASPSCSPRSAARSERPRHQRGPARHRPASAPPTPTCAPPTSRRCRTPTPPSTPSHRVNALQFAPDPPHLSRSSARPRTGRPDRGQPVRGAGAHEGTWCTRR